MKAADVLADEQNQVERNGIVIRKGSGGAFLVNARICCDQAAEADRRACAEQDIIDALPALRELGLFEILSIRDAALQRLVDTR